MLANNVNSKIYFSFVITAVLVCILMVFTLPVSSQTIRIVFLHHSCGHNLIEQGGVRQGLTALGYEFYDHGYNGDGLRLADGTYTGEHFDIPGDNTDPDGLAELFSQPLNSPPNNAFSHLMQYDVIAFKSCFPTSNISSDGMLDEYRRYYLSMRDRMDQYPEKVFIIVTQPPQVPNNTDKQEGRRAREFTEWLQSDEYLGGHDNIFVFDFFDHLAGSDNFLRKEYRVDNWDAHPNERANQEIAPLFVDFIDAAIRGYGVVPQSQPVEPQAEEQAPAESAGDSGGEALTSTDSDAIDDFEASQEPWESYVDGTGSTIECVPDSQYAFSGSHSLRVNYKLKAGGWAGCEKHLGHTIDFSSREGISFALRAASTGQDITITLNTGDPNVAVYPYEVHLMTTPQNESDFVTYHYTWAEFKVPEWGDPAAPAELDPSQIISIAINFGSESGQEGTFWVDRISLGSLGQIAAQSEDAQQQAQPQSQEQPSQQSDEQQGVGGLLRGVCPLSTALIPMTMVAAFLLQSRRRNRT